MGFRLPKNWNLSSEDKAAYTQIAAKDMWNAADILESSNACDTLHALAKTCGPGSERYLYARDTFQQIQRQLVRDIPAAEITPTQLAVAHLRQAARKLNPLVASVTANRAPL